MTTADTQVTAEDREAWIAMDDLSGSSARACREGRYDDCAGIRILQRHRLAAEKQARDAERAACAEVARTAVTYVVGEQRDLCDRIAAAIIARGEPA